MSQLDVFGGHTRDPGELTDRQQHAYDLVRTSPGGATADEVGAAWHAARGKHGPDERCKWCAEEGASVLRSKGLAPLIVRRRNGHWEPRNPEDTETRTSGLIATSEPDPSLNPFADL